MNVRCFKSSTRNLHSFFLGRCNVGVYSRTVFIQLHSIQTVETTPNQPFLSVVFEETRIDGVSYINFT